MGKIISDDSTHFPSFIESPLYQNDNKDESLQNQSNLNDI